MNPEPVSLLLRRIWHYGKDFLCRPNNFVETVLSFNSSTDYIRWARNDSLQPQWDERTQIIAEYIPPGADVIEFGAGRQVLRWCLPHNCKYYPSDLVARTPDTIVCDLNVTYPDLGSGMGVAVFSGVLEYIRDISSVFGWLHGQVGRVVFSYATLEHTPSPLMRRQNGWVSDFTQDQIVQIVTQMGFEGGPVARWRGHVIFVVTRS